MFVVKHVLYTLPVCDLVANVRAKPAYISAPRQDRDFGFSLKDVLLSVL